MRSADPDDDQARFLADLRALRDTAAIGYEELAARAHYPSDVLKEAENGPCLPSLPVLAAYVRACEGNVLDWEERWRRLGDETRAEPGLPVRPAGASAAAVAGARAGISVGPPDAYDPDRIRAVLRGDHRRTAEAHRQAEQQGALASWPRADGPAASGVNAAGWDSGASRDTPGAWDGSAAPQDSSADWRGNAEWAAAASRDTATPPAAGWAWDSTTSTTPGEGSADRGWDAAASGDTTGGWFSKAGPDAGPSREASSGWDAGPSRDASSGWDTGPSRDASSGWEAGTSVSAAAGLGAVGSGPGFHDAADRDAGPPSGTAERARAIRADPFSSSWLQDSERASRQEEGNFSWLQPGARGGEPQAPDTASGGPARAGTDRPVAAAGADRAVAAAGAGQSRGAPVERAGAAQSRVPVERAGFTGSAVSQGRTRRRERRVSLRLLMVVVVAALIGSVLILLLR